MKKFFEEFKQFISKGNVMDLAVGVIIGGAFQSIVNSLVNDILMPLLSMITGGVNFASWAVTIGKGELENPATLTYGNFISAIINFLLMAVVLFLIIKAMNSAKSALAKPKAEVEEEKVPTTKICPFCKSEIAIDATRCPHCTSQLDK
ncbi:MAG: large conductance mechanosensitive channel protein MscL [Eubacteriales bacterium]|nr:large conductance mechanosensitive channel protein MscL [Eubacteriales bacterium]